MAATIYRSIASRFLDLVVAITAANGAIKFVNAASGSSYNGELAVPTPGGLAMLNYNGGAGAYTLQAPVAGSPYPTASSTNPTTGQQGDDGLRLTIRSSTARAHVVTAPAGKIITTGGVASATMTFAANAGAFIELQAYNGLWYVVQATGVTIT